MCQFFIVAFNPHCCLIIYLFFSGSLLFFIMRHVISFGWLLLSFPAVRVILISAPLVHFFIMRITGVRFYIHICFIKNNLVTNIKTKNHDGIEAVLKTNVAYI